MIDEILEIYNPWWHEEYRPPGVPRPKYLDALERAFKSQSTVVVHGLRRVGKTTVLKQYIARSLSRLGSDRVFFLSMDHPDLEKVSILEALRTCRRINRARRSEPALLVIDEVHAREGFEKELKVLADTEPSLRVIASGSSSLTVRHRSAAMTGRYNRVEVKPLDLGEYAVFTDREAGGEPQIMESLAEEYLSVGGMPQYVLTGDPEVLVNLVDDIIYKDIAGRYGVSDPGLLKDLFFLLMERVGKPLSFSKMGRIAGVGTDTGKRYAGYFEEAGLIGLVEKLGKPNVRKYSPRKCYAPDNGIRTVAAGRGSLGSLAENAALSRIKRFGVPVYYALRDGMEVDFVTEDRAVEVKYRDSLDPEDVATLSDFGRRGKVRKYVVTRRLCDSPAKGIKVVPLWELLTRGLP